MADNGSSNTAIVAIVVLVIIAIGIAFFSGFFTTQGGGTSKIIEKPVIEKPIIEKNIIEKPTEKK